MCGQSDCSSWRGWVMGSEKSSRIRNWKRQSLRCVSEPPAPSMAPVLPAAVLIQMPLLCCSCFTPLLMRR